MTAMPAPTNTTGCSSDEMIGLDLTAHAFEPELAGIGIPDIIRSVG